MARFVGIVSLLLGLGMTAWFSEKERGQRSSPVTVEDGAHSMEGGDPMPTPRP